MTNYNAIAESIILLCWINFRLSKKKEFVLENLRLAFNAIRYTLRELSSIIKVRSKISKIKKLKKYLNDNGHANFHLKSNKWHYES